MTEECLYYKVTEVQKMLGVSEGHAYKIIRGLNKELKEMGFIVVAGRVSKQYFKEKYYGMK